LKYDKLGNRLSMKISDANTQVYRYDKLYQLIFVDYNDGNSRGYDYDKLGNRRIVVNGVTTAYTSNALNQYENVAGTSYTYDKNGNLTYDGVYHYYYDCENRLTDVNNAADAAIVSYKYDYKGRRVARTAGTTTITYLYDGDQIITDYISTAWQRMYYYGPAIDQPICMVRRISFVYYYHYDGLGSVVAMSAYNGSLIEKYTYDVYGKPTIKSQTGDIRPASAYNNRYMFTGREYDPNVGIYYYRARYYHPTIGRFMQKDPIGYEDNLNLYIYCYNDPINRTDRMGLAAADKVKSWKADSQPAKGACIIIKCVASLIGEGGTAARAVEVSWCIGMVRDCVTFCTHSVKVAEGDREVCEEKCRLEYPECLTRAAEGKCQMKFEINFK
jgi:RHS repeat-associated protein